jgi:thiol-disulfide isomerase/thioredoxin
MPACRWPTSWRPGSKSGHERARFGALTAHEEAGPGAGIGAAPTIGRFAMEPPSAVISVPHSLQIGPLSLPLSLLLVLAAVVFAHVLGQRLGRRHGVDLEPALWRVLLATVLGARLAFVWQYRSAYVDAPWSVLDIRDGGWDAQLGLVAGWLAALWLARTQPAQRKPLLTTLAAASALWIVGSIVLVLQTSRDQGLPALALVRADGTTQSLRAFEGRPTVVNLWATWCPPCRREMPALQQAQAEHPGVHFVFVNQGEPPATVLGFLAAQRLTLDHVLFDLRGEVGRAFGHRSLPTTLFFDARGRLVDTRIGELSRATLAQRLQAITGAGGR